MASFLDIAPALGRGLDFAQGFPGGYDAIDLRRAASTGLQEGAVAANAYKASQRSAGANMSVDVASEQGAFLVQGDDVSGQGLYTVPALSATSNLDVSASNPTNPRIDQVVLEARDDAHTLDGITRARVYVLAGTPTSGATLDNRNGAAALPASTARLADILVPATSTSVTTANIRDRRTWANGARAVRSTNANTTVAIGTAQTTIAGLAQRVELIAGNLVRYSFRGLGFDASIANVVISGGMTANGTLIKDGVFKDVMPLSNTTKWFDWTWEATTAGGSMLIACLQQASVASAVWSNTIELIVEEIVGGSANNGTA